MPSVPRALAETSALRSTDWEPDRAPEPARPPSGVPADVAPSKAPLTVPARPPPALALPDFVLTEWVALALPWPETAPVTDWDTAPRLPSEPPTAPAPTNEPPSEPVNPPVAPPSSCALAGAAASERDRAMALEKTRRVFIE